MDDSPKIIGDEENEETHKVPNKEKVHTSIQGLNRNSTYGLNGMAKIIYQDDWNIVGDDIYKMVQYFFSGEELPRFVTHTNLVLLSRKAIVQNFSDVTPISLSDFVNKIFSRIIHERIKKFLPRIIFME